MNEDAPGTVDDLNVETLIAHPDLEPFVWSVENGFHQPTLSEAMLVDVIVRQQDALVAVLAHLSAYTRQYGILVLEEGQP